VAVWADRHAGSGIAALVQEAMVAVWRTAESGRPTRLFVPLKDSIVATIPTDEDSDLAFSDVWEDAGAAAFYALEACEAGEARQVMMTLRRADEMLITQLVDKHGLDVATPAVQAMVTSHPLWQREQRRQTRDLAVVSSANDLDVGSLHARAVLEPLLAEAEYDALASGAMT
jgi:hypothetical protein